MIFFLALGLVLCLAIPGILIVFIPAGIALVIPFVLFRRKKNKTKTTLPELSLEGRVWQCIKRQYPDAIQWEWANGTQKSRLQNEGQADIVITNWDYSIKQFVLFTSENRFWIEEKVDGFSGIKRINFGTIPSDPDTVDSTPDPAPQNDPVSVVESADSTTEKEKPKNKKDAPVPAPRVHHGRPAPMPIDYSALAFEWVTAHLAEISEQLSIALDAGENSCLLDSGFLPKQEAWKNVAEELNIACDLDTEITDIGIVISQKQAA